MELDQQLEVGLIQEVQRDILAFMAPELLVPSRYNLTKSAPTRETDIYAFSLVILQVIELRYPHPLAVLDVQPGPDRRATVSQLQAPGTRVLRLVWLSSRKTRGCKGNWDLRSLVGPYPEVLGR